eukprot:1091720-Amphidinium_carterae.1
MTTNTIWFPRCELDNMFQINGDRTARTTNNMIPIGKYMEIKTTFTCTRRRIIADKNKTKHFHDFASLRPGWTTTQTMQ